MLFLISISFAPIFPFSQGYLYPCYVPALFTPCSALFFFFSWVHCIQSFALFSVLPALLTVPEACISHSEILPYSTSLCRLWCMKLRLLLYRCHPLGVAAHPRALEKHHLTFLLCSFTHAGEFRHFCYMLEHLARINNYFILFTFSGSLFLNSVIVIALFLIAT